MAVDVTGGMDPSGDHFLAQRPADPEFRESAPFWVSDNAGVIGLPRMGIEAVAGSWDLRRMQVNVDFPDGRAVMVREPRRSSSTASA